MSLKIKSTLKDMPIRLLVYGRGGVGKSTLAAAFPRPVFLASEDGLENIDAVGASPATWEDLLDGLDELTLSKSFDTIVIDSLDWFEPLCWDAVCRRGDDKGPKKSIEDFGYGKGYVAALNEWRILVSKLSSARISGKAIVLVAHAVKKTVKNPAGEDYDSWAVKLNDKIAGLIREWVDIVAFAEAEVVVAKLVPNESSKGFATGKRILRTAPSAAYESKTRFALPSKIPLEWSAFNSAVKAGSFAGLPALRAELDTRLEKLANLDVTAGARAFLSQRGHNVASLREALKTVERYEKGEVTNGKG